MMEESQQCQQNQKQLPFPSSFRIEDSREWGPCVLGLDQASRVSLPSISPPVFCGVIAPCVHEPALESLGLGSYITPSSLSGGEQERLARAVQSDSYIAWLLRTIPSEVADGARCSMGILEHTTASSIIKEAIAAGIDIRCVRVSSYSDPVRFRQFLFEAFPMIDNIFVYPRTASSSTTSTATGAMMNISSGSGGCGSQSGSMGSCCSSCLSSTSSSTSPSLSSVPAILCAAGIVAHSARDELSRHLLFRQRHFPTPLARSPLSHSVNGLRKRDRMASSSSPCFFGEPMYRCRPCMDEDESERAAAVRCVPYAGSEFGDSHCGLVSSSLPQRPLISQSQSVPINVYDFYDDDDDSDMIGITSPKRLRVVPCSPPITTVFTSEDSMPGVCSTNASESTSTRAAHNSGTSAEHSCSPPYLSSSLFVSPPFGSSSSATATNASASVPVLPPYFGIASPI